MSSLNILDINDDCLTLLLDYLTLEEQINFAQVCQRFRAVFIAWAGKQYREFVIDEGSSRNSLIALCICREAVRTLTIDLDHFDTARTFRCYGCESPINCFDILCFNLSGMISLKRLIIKQIAFLLTPIEKPFERIFVAAKDLNELKILKVHSESEKTPKSDLTFDTIWQLRSLEELHLQVRDISTPILVKCCKSNPNLRMLYLGYGCVRSKLGDIAPHCANLETLQFGMMAEASAYKPLARLPKLRQLIHTGARGSNSFVPLLKALAVRPQLQCLQIDGGTLSPQETVQIIRQRQLQQLKCFCSTAECVEMLAQLKQLKKLSIWMSSGCDISDALLKVIGECRQLQLLRIASANLKSDFIDNVLKLLLDLRADEAQESLQLELPIARFAKPIEESKLLSCSAYEFSSWTL